MNKKEFYNLLTKYHLVREPECKIGPAELYVFHPMDKVYEGSAVSYGLRGLPMVAFAKGIRFNENSGVPCVSSYGWDETITEDKYEAKLASLEKQFNKAVSDYKNYLVKQKLNKMKGDFK